MRTIHFYVDRANHQLVQGLDSAAPMGALSLVQGDKVRFAVHDFVRQAAPSARLYAEQPLDFEAIRVSIGSPDRAPSRGTFKLRVDGQETAELTWPTELTTSVQIAAWKTTVLNAVKALSNVGADGVRLDDPTGTPAHLFYFTWLDAERDDEIEVIANRLLPATETTTQGTFTPVGYTQLVKFAQFPVVTSGDFEREDPPAVSVIETRPGAAGTNEEQTVIIPAGAVGSVSLAWNGSSTKTMAVETLTAESLAAALNAIVVDGGTNPSFAVESRRAREGKRFAVEFIGPLAAAAQAMLVPTMHDQEPVPWATGTMDLDRLRVELELNGEASVETVLELVIVSEGEETYLLPVTLQNDHTSGETASNAEGAGAVTVIERTVYVDSGLGVPFVEAAPGASFSPPEAGSSYVINHALGTKWPRVHVLKRVSEDPEEWEQVHDNLYTATAETENTVRVTFPFELSDTETIEDQPNPLYRERWKVYVASPDSQLVMYNHEHTWAQVRETLPSGMTLATKLAALEASIGMVGGALAVPAANITGLISGAQVDITSLITALSNTQVFTQALTTQVEQSATLMTAIAERLGEMPAFVETLKEVFTSSTELQTTLVRSLITNTEFRAAVIQALQLGAGTNTSVIPFVIPDWEESLPAEGEGWLPAARMNPSDEGTITGYLPRASADNAGEYYTVENVAFAPPRRAKRFEGGAKVYSTGTDWFAGEIEDSTVCSLGLLEFSDLVYTGASASVVIYGSFFKDTGTDGLTFALYKDAGRTQLIGSFTGDDAMINGISFNFTGITGFSGITAISGRVDGFLSMPDTVTTDFELTRTVSNFIRSVEHDKELFTISVSEAMLAEGTRFVVSAAVSLQLLGNCEGYCVLEVRRGHQTSEASADLDGIVWDETIISQAITITDAAVLHAFQYAVERDDEGVLSAEKTLYTQTSAAAVPGSASFIVQARLIRFDTQNVSNPRGRLIRSMIGARASIVALED